MKVRRCDPRLALLAAGLAIAVVGLAAGPAEAQTVRRSGGGAPRGTVGGFDDPLWGRAGPWLCRRWCLSDRNPCDTVQMKVTDGRCSDEITTFVGELRCRIGGDPNPACPQPLPAARRKAH
jgi:hypothetical protein